VGIVIVNWNGRRWLEQFLPALMSGETDLFDVFVVDNASSDDSVAFLAMQYPEVKILQQTTNLGFAAGNNAALPVVQNPYILLLNSDVEVTEGWLKPLLLTMQLDLELAAVQPKIRAWHARGHFEYAGASGGFIDAYGYPFCRGRIFDVLEADQGQYDTPMDVFWTSGACMLIRKEVVDKIGLFDDTFFAHMEEIDFCWRAQNHGWKLAVVPTSTVYHVGGGTLPKGNPRKVYYNFRNGLLMLLKNLPSRSLFGVIFIRLILDGVAAIRALVGGDWRFVVAVLRAHFHFYARIPAVLRTRKGQKQLPLRELSGYYPRLLIWDHFARGKRLFSQLGRISTR
jgi:GT2 family glycosyltransferase